MFSLMAAPRTLDADTSRRILYSCSFSISHIFRSNSAASMPPVPGTATAGTLALVLSSLPSIMFIGSWASSFHANSRSAFVGYEPYSPHSPFSVDLSLIW